MKKSGRSTSLARIVNQMQDFDDNDENAEVSEEAVRPDTEKSRPVTRHPLNSQSMRSTATIEVTKPSRAATSYMPGESAFVSASLLARMKDDLFEHVTLFHGKLPGSKIEMEMFTGRDVIDTIQDMGYAETREEGFAVAARIYADGLFRALQPGPFSDSSKSVYRFRSEMVRVLSPSPKARGRRALSEPAPHTPDGVKHDRTLFSIAAILKTNDDWINTSFVHSPGQMDNTVDSTETDENSTL